MEESGKALVRALQSTGLTLTAPGAKATTAAPHKQVEAKLGEPSRRRTRKQTLSAYSAAALEQRHYSRAFHIRRGFCGECWACLRNRKVPFDEEVTNGGDKQKDGNTIMTSEYTQTI